MISAFAARVLRMRLGRSAPDTATLLVRAAATPLNAHGMCVVIDDVEDDYADVFDPIWAADPPARDGVPLFAAPTPGVSVRNALDTRARL